MPLPDVAMRISERSKQMVQLVDSLRKNIDEIKNKIYEQQAKRLRAENNILKSEVETWKARLTQAEVRNGITQVPLPTSKPETVPNLEKQAVNVSKTEVGAVKSDTMPVEINQKEIAHVSKKAEKKPAKPKKEQPSGDDDTKPIDVSRLDFRIGIIQAAKKHPDADSLYVEQVDIGEKKPRTVVSGLVKHVPLEEMQNRWVVLLCNLKPAKMRGVLSEAMVMCASSPEKVEILNPPPTCTPGERVIFEGYPGEPDTQLNPKKKIFEQLAPDLKTDENCIATYKGAPFTVKGKGIVKAASMANVNIK